MIGPCICGIDPGLHGGIAFYWPHEPEYIDAHDLPIIHNELDGGELARMLKSCDVKAVWIEKVAAMLGQGVSSTFTFGKAYGTILGIIQTLEIPRHYIMPGKWKKHYGLDKDKEKSRKRIIDLFPSSPHFKRKKDHQRAEASLIALYGAEKLRMGELA